MRSTSIWQPRKICADQPFRIAENPCRNLAPTAQSSRQCGTQLSALECNLRAALRLIKLLYRFVEDAVIFKVHGAPLSFQFDDYLNQTVCRFALDAWAGFTSENSREGCHGANVIFILEPPSYEAHPVLGPQAKYEAALMWLLSNQIEARETVLSGVMSHIETMRSEYGIEDEELNGVETPDQLKRMVDLSFVRVFPHSKNGHPYLGFELECNWDPEHGCGVLINNNAVVDVGASESAQSIAAIEDHGGAV